MKNLLKFKYLPVAALILGGGLAAAENSFKPDRNALEQLYAKVGGQWQPTPVDPADEGQSGGWRCDGDEQICTGSFASTPAPGAPDPEDATAGTFVTIP